MYTVFVIGNLASGKSTAAKYLAQQGGRLLDLDQMAKDLYQPQSAVLSAIADAFGDDVLDEDGALRTWVLARRAFASPEATAELNGIVHPVLLQKLGDVLVEPCGCGLSQPTYPFTVVEVSVADAFTEAFPLADEIIAITAPLDIRRQRAIERGMTADDFDRRAEVQPSEKELCALASTVIDNSAGDDALFRTLDAWLDEHGLLNPQLSLQGDMGDAHV